jgi:hypothetical protein
MKIKAHAGKAIKTAQVLKEISGLPLTDCVSICKGNEEFPEECFAELCEALNNKPDDFFSMSE